VPADEIGTVTMGEIGPCDRQTAQIPWPGASPDTVVCVQIAGTGLPEIGWNVYPPGAFVDLKAP
jgi:hypothetical protein